ncbi:SemiSWEET transporter [Litorimonas sp. WD9-15]|uniref:SemiSWEET transporter n=1 Tax=Litorimonas sp. WD9-15 TaxID=3418716 RepID=UPI003D0620EB
MDHITLLGYVAAILTSLSFIPQAWLVIRTGRTDGISLLMYAAFTLGVACWLIYGLFIQAFPVVAANAVTLTLAVIIFTVTARERWASRNAIR